MNIPTPVELLQEKGVIGEILRQLHQSSHTVLKKAEAQDDPWSWLAALEKEGFKRTDVGVYSVDPATRRDAKVYQGVREIRFNFHEPDSTSIIMRIVMDGCWPDDFRKTFEAAKSQWEAELRLAEIARGGGSV